MSVISELSYLPAGGEKYPLGAVAKTQNGIEFVIVPGYRSAYFSVSDGVYISQTTWKASNEHPKLTKEIIADIEEQLALALADCSNNCRLNEIACS